jgi:hypothetical protein
MTSEFEKAITGGVTVKRFCELLAQAHDIAKKMAEKQGRS